MPRNKLSPIRRHDFRVTFSSINANCMTCDLAVDWSKHIDIKAAQKATLGHVIAEEIGGKANPWNCGVQCWACNWSAKTARKTDLTNDILPNALRDWLPSKIAGNANDPRECAPTENLPDWQARKAARKARGLTW